MDVKAKTNDCKNSGWNQYALKSNNKKSLIFINGSIKLKFS